MRGRFGTEVGKIVSTVLIPTEITTERLLMRQWRTDDFEPFAKIMANTDVVKYLGDGKPLTRPLAWRQMAMWAGHWALRGYGNYALELKATGTFIGRAGPWFPDGWPGLEIGWLISPQYRGNGYATEAGLASLKACREQLRAERVISLIRPENQASIRVAEKLGGTIESRMELMGAAALIYSYPAVDAGSSS